ncbi:MAG: hypothetical protein R2734_03830 [Nocardioides sp.]
MLADTTLPAHRLLDRALAIEDALSGCAPRRPGRSAHPGHRRDRRRRPAVPRRRPGASTPGRPPAASCCGRGTIVEPDAVLPDGPVAELA